MINYEWIAISGNYENDGNKIIYKGGLVPGGEHGELLNPAIGHYMCDQYFQEGKIKASFEFTDNEDECDCDIILYYSNSNSNYEVLTIGIDKAKYSLFALKHFKNGKWNFYQFSGDSRSFKENQRYELEVEYFGSNVKLKVNGVETINYRLPFITGRTQVGIWNRSYKNIYIHQFEIIERVHPKAFVIMQFSEQFNELYNDIIKPVCREFNLDVKRADDIYNNGIIVHDIIKNIENSTVIIADITPINANVYYEVGYAHALNKNTILLAEETVKLPFDVSSYRVIFYKNTIGGKKNIEEKLRMHLVGVMK